jgi:hypothetical protein
VFRILVWTLVLGFLSQLKFTYFAIASAASSRRRHCGGRLLVGARRGAPAAWLPFGVAAAWVAAGQNLGQPLSLPAAEPRDIVGLRGRDGIDESWGCLPLGLRARAPVRASLSGGSGARCPTGRMRSAPRFSSASRSLSCGRRASPGRTWCRWAATSSASSRLSHPGARLPGAPLPGRRWHWFDGAVPFCLLALAFFDPDYYRQGPGVILAAPLRERPHPADMGALPSEWQRLVEEASAGRALPAIREAVGRGTVDVYDFNTGAALLNGMRLVLAADLPELLGLHAEPRGMEPALLPVGPAPDFLLWSDERVDNRYPGQDDAPLMAGLPGHYEPLFPEAPILAFQEADARSQRRRSSAASSTAGRSSSRRRSSFRPSAPKPSGLRADPVPTGPRAISKRRVQACDHQYRGHGRPRGAERLEDGAADFEGRLPLGADPDPGRRRCLPRKRGEASSWVRSFHFEAPPGQEEFWSHVDVSVFEMPGLPVRLGGPAGR